MDEEAKDVGANPVVAVALEGDMGAKAIDGRVRANRQHARSIVPIILVVRRCILELVGWKLVDVRIVVVCRVCNCFACELDFIQMLWVRRMEGSA